MIVHIKERRREDDPSLGAISPAIPGEDRLRLLLDILGDDRILEPRCVRVMLSEHLDHTPPSRPVRAPHSWMARHLNGDLGEEVTDDTLFPRSPTADRRYGPTR